jgi:glycosyltransferase involved in cell wall biosynthesis
MKIAFIISSLDKRGSIRVMYELACEFVKRDLDITIYYFSELGGFTFPCKTQKISFKERIDFDSYDVVHSSGIRPDSYVYYHYKHMSRSKTITTMHSYVKEDLKSQYNATISFVFTKFWNIMMTRHDRVVVLSADAKKYYEKFWKNKNIEVVYNGISQYMKKGRTPYQKENNDQIIIGAVGLITEIKGFEQIIKVLQKDKNLFLYMVGNGKDEEALKQLSADLGVSKQVEFLGFQKNVEKYLQMFDIYVMPSRAEGFPIALLEAASIAKATVCSDIPIFKEIFSEKEIVFFKLDDIDDFYRSIMKAYDTKISLEESIHNRFIRDYTSKVMADKYLDLYKNI